MLTLVMLAMLGQGAAEPKDTRAPAEPKRVATARAAAGPRIREAFQRAGVAYPPGEIFLRAFKREQQLELWAGPRGKELSLVKRYPVCALSGSVGPKRRQGDLQVPEGVYRIVRFNPWSNFHLSMGLDYPNASDRIAGARAGTRDLGGDIYIHGGCATVGCLPMGDDGIEELYFAALDARAGGQPSIQVHVFPHRLDAESLVKLGEQTPDLLAFWTSLQPIFDAFERSHRPPRVSVDPRTGSYRLEPRARGRCPIPGTAR
ncbi:MAG TPA: L,D-transpeptidase family protein [Myxococcales bacterium]|nr:L,D-transpeptidase family protein [Myxococcales bacterium]